MKENDLGTANNTPEVSTPVQTKKSSPRAASATSDGTPEPDEAAWKTVNPHVSTPSSAATASPGVSFNPRVESLKVKPGQPCSPVREEEVADEEFTSDLSKLDKRFSRDKLKQHSGLTGEQQRRQTLAASEGLETHSRGGRRRVSLGGTSKSSNTRRVSFGGCSTPSSASSSLHGGVHASESHLVNDLKEELSKREKLDFTRQNRLNGMDIKLKETQSKYNILQTKYREQKKEKDDLIRQLNEMKKKNKQLMMSKRRLEQKNKEQDDTIKKLLSKVGSLPNQRRTLSHSSSQHSVPAGASTGASPEQEEEEEFGDAEKMLSKSTSASSLRDAPRRYTMAPGEVPRFRHGPVSGKRSPVTSSHYIRVDGLEKGTNSHKLLAMCQEYGAIAQLRVTSDVVTGILKGYVTFLDTKFARAAVKGLREKGFRAMLVDQP